MAEYPERIKRIFVAGTVNKAGCYGVKLYHNGEFKEILVDDFFPCQKNSISPSGY